MVVDGRDINLLERFATLTCIKLEEEVNCFVQVIVAFCTDVFEEQLVCDHVWLPHLVEYLPGLVVLLVAEQLLDLVIEVLCGWRDVRRAEGLEGRGGVVMLSRPLYHLGKPLPEPFGGLRVGLILGEFA